MTRALLTATALTGALLAAGGPALAQDATTRMVPAGPPVLVQPMVPESSLPPGTVPQPLVPGATIIQTDPGPPRGNTRTGQLRCDVAGGISWVFGSTRSLTCEFRPSNGPVELYAGEIRRFGVDIGFTGRSTIVWTVVSTGSDIAPGSLAGNYGGASSNIAAGLGLGSAALIGGSGDQVALQPLSIESSTGVNLAAGIAELSLRPAG
ncbi:DUF992 domain-containing protein [Muricoccus aerilatus]|uniref:DUF992 domain-containing protein n=1 Tax=Muricoccus aerilatus TaxID=452982 RepID=UPI0006939DD5|nr:DUF992 domain-containing protein [Roseomonas aerilata]